MQRFKKTASDTDCVVVGASFAGFASSFALARAGLRVSVLEKKTDPGVKLRQCSGTQNALAPAGLSSVLAG